MPEVGFSYMEVGTVTTDPYTGNPGPRLWRLPNSKALVVNFGLKNIGVKRIIQKLRDYKRTNFVLGISIGMTNSVKNKSIEAGVEDYYQCLRSLVRARIGKLYVINISCPNTFGGEPYTTPNKLDKLLKKLTTVKTRKPVFVKMPINLSWLEFEALLKVIVKYPMAGVIIGNLNKDRSRSEIKDPLPVSVKGGISGLPTQALSNTLIGKTYRKYGKKLTIIGVGGVFSAKDAYTKIRLGASLVSLITGMIYQGPQLIGQINEELVGMLEKDGFKSLSEAVGADSRTS
jgi:dihydroorotate dehydrogenase subfamily 2